MAGLEIEGRIASKLGVQSGSSARGPWAKQEFIVEFQDGNFPTSACFMVWGEDKVKDLEKFQVGDQVRISFTVSSREYNGRWYNDLRAWRIAPVGAQAPAAAPSRPSAAPSQSASGYDVPAGFAPSAPAPTIDDMPGESEGDDLPF